MASASASENPLTIKSIEDAETKYFGNVYRLKYKAGDTIKHPEIVDDSSTEAGFLPPNKEPLHFEYREGKKYILYSWNGSIYFTLDRELNMDVTDQLGSPLLEGTAVCFVDPTAQLVGHMANLKEDEIKLSPCETEYIKTSVNDTTGLEE